MGMFLSVYLKITKKKKEGFQTLVETNFIPFHLNKQLLIYNDILVKNPPKTSTQRAAYKEDTCCYRT